MPSESLTCHLKSKLVRDIINIPHTLKPTTCPFFWQCISIRFLVQEHYGWLISTIQFWFVELTHRLYFNWKCKLGEQSMVLYVGRIKSLAFNCFVKSIELSTNRHGGVDRCYSTTSYGSTDAGTKHTNESFCSCTACMAFSLTLNQDLPVCLHVISCDGGDTAFFIFHTCIYCWKEMRRDAFGEKLRNNLYFSRNFPSIIKHCEECDICIVWQCLVSLISLLTVLHILCMCITIVVA